MATALVALAAILLAAGCRRDDPEMALRATIEVMQTAIEERDAAAMQQHLADDFIGNDGLDRSGARRMAAGYLLRHRQVAIDFGPIGITLDQAHATARFTAVLRGGSGSLLPDAAQVYDVETGWRLEGGEWMLTSARWTPAL